MWAALVPIIARYGFQVAEALWRKWSSGADPTAQDWLDLKALGQQTPEQLALAAASAANIPPDDPRVQQILALLTPPPVA